MIPGEFPKGADLEAFQGTPGGYLVHLKGIRECFHGVSCISYKIKFASCSYQQASSILTQTVYENRF